MKEERMLILNMLNEGKITADEAVALLNAIAVSENTNGFNNFARGVKEKAADIAEKAEPKVKKAAKNIKNKSVEVFENIKEKIKDKKNQSEECDEDIVEVVIEDEETEE